MSLFSILEVTVCSAFLKVVGPFEAKNHRTIERAKIILPAPKINAFVFSTTSANDYYEFFGASLGFGLAGASFAVGIAYTSVWFPKNQQGTALGIFGAGNAVAALTSVAAPSMLLEATVTAVDLESQPLAPQSGWLSLASLPATAHGVLVEDELVAARRSELRAADLQERAQAAARNRFSVS